MNETSNRYAKAEPMARFIFARGIADQARTYSDDEWREFAVEAGVSDGTYVPSAETRAFALFLADEMAKNAADPFRGL